MRIHISANKVGVGMDYLSVLRTMLTRPLIKKGVEGIPKVIELMNEYSITREDFDTICELATWPNQKDPMSEIATQTKSAFTRQYNKEAHKNPFTLVDVKKLKGAKLSDDASALVGEDGQEEEEEEIDQDDIKSDAMIKMKERKATAAATKASTSGVKRAAKADTDGGSKSKKTKTK
jgi:replication factor C subunit 1